MDKALHRYAAVVASCTLLLVVAGGLVTSNDAGLSVPDWPLSFGKLMPVMQGGVLYEHGHRMIATTVGVMTIVLAVWLWESEKRRWVRNLGWTALGLVIVQGLLGGLTVLMRLPKPVSMAHACLAELFFSLTVAIAIFTSPRWRGEPRVVADSGWPPLRAMAAAVPALVLAQAALGAGVRHQAFGVIPHIVGAMAVTAAILMTTIATLSQHKDHPELRRAARTLLTLAFLQVFLGIAAYASRIITSGADRPAPSMVLWTVLHVATGALTLAASVGLAIEVFRQVRPEAASPAVHRAATLS